MMPEKYDLAAEKFEPKTGKGNVYVVRGKLGASFTVLGLGSGGTATLLHVDLDGRRYGSLTTGTYMLFELDPGRYVLSSTARENVDHEAVDVVAGDNYFIEIKPTIGFGSARVSLERVDAEHGRKLVIGGERVQPFPLKDVSGKSFAGQQVPEPQTQTQKEGLQLSFPAGAQWVPGAEKNVLVAPAADLAEGYLAAKTSLGVVKAGAFDGPGARVTFNIRGETINKDNVDEYRARYQKQLSLYKEAIKQRGYASIAGAYKGEATKSCASSNSLWAAIVQEKAHSGIEIRQEGIDAQIVIRLKQNDKEMSIENLAAIAETTIIVIDSMNSEYYFQGTIKDQTIVLKPNLSVLNTWPKWANPPSRNDLENCTITLVPL
jgi:head-tail adaptor